MQHAVALWTRALPFWGRSCTLDGQKNIPDTRRHWFYFHTCTQAPRNCNDIQPMFKISLNFLLQQVMKNMTVLLICSIKLEPHEYNTIENPLKIKPTRWVPSYSWSYIGVIYFTHCFVELWAHLNHPGGQQHGTQGAQVTSDASRETRPQPPASEGEIFGHGLENLLEGW